MTHIERATVELHYVKHLLEYAKEDEMTEKEIDALQRKAEYLEAVVEALSRSDNADHLRRTTEMVPLTIDQLRGMDGKPVWIERNDEPHDGKWLIVEYADTENPDKTLYTREGTTYSDYGTYFTAYAYPPAHIDREAWTSEWINSIPALGAGDLETRCKSCGNLVLFETDFCPYCGKAMTEEAWAELEKRVRGRIL